MNDLGFICGLSYNFILLYQVFDIERNIFPGLTTGVEPNCYAELVNIHFCVIILISH